MGARTLYGSREKCVVDGVAVDAPPKAFQTDLRIDLRPARPPPTVEDEAADQHRSPEDGSPDPDRVADEPCDDNRKQKGGIDPENEHGFSTESAHASRAN